MNLLRTYQSKSLVAVISFLLWLSFIASAFAAEHLEVRIRLNTTWKSQTQTYEQETIATCVLGTNDWYISGQFLKNANVEYWLIGTNVIERKEISSSMYLAQAKDFISEKIGTKRPPTMLGRHPTKGETFTRTSSWLEPFGYGVERAVWLAFCSGSFLHTPDRQIPLPIGHFSDVQRYIDKTILFENQSGIALPKSIDLFTYDGSLACSYAVLSSTNVVGRAIPLEFRLIQYGNPGPRRVGTNTSQYVVLGKIVAIKPCEKPALPDIQSTR